MEGAIRRPDAPQHFMVLKPANKRVVVRLPDGQELASSTNAIRLIEVGRTIFDPVWYFPVQDVSVKFLKQENSTFCPLKGEASYFTFSLGGQDFPNLAWSYEAPLDISRGIAGLLAFYPDKVLIEEHPNQISG